MKKILAFLLICVLLLSLFACGKPKDNNKPNDNNNNNNSNETPDNNTPETTKVEGIITNLTKNSDGLVSFIVYTTTKQEYMMTLKSGSIAEPKLGQKVSVTVEGAIAQSTPAQATAGEITVLEEFTGVLQTAEVYKVDSIQSSKIQTTMGSSNWIFKSFSDYTECQNFMNENELTKTFQDTIGNTEIKGLTEEFFANNNLYLFIVNSGNSGESAANEIYLQNDMLFLKLNNQSTEADLSNFTYKAYLISLPKNTEIAGGLLLVDSTLNSNLDTPNDDVGNDPQENTENTNPDNTTGTENQGENTGDGTTQENQATE